jgi:serine/threonine-protein kinase ATR
MIGAWDDVQTLVDQTKAETAPMVIARLLLAMRTGDASAIAESASITRLVLGAPISASGPRGYRRSYEAVLNLNLTHELEVIHNVISNLPAGSQGSARRGLLTELSQTLSSRLNVTPPTFRVREPILSMRRTAFALTSAH